MRGHPKTYSGEELAYIEALAALPRELIAAELAEVFGRSDLTADHVRQLCIRHGWLTREKWTPAEDAQLCALFADRPTAVVAATLGRSVTTTSQRAYKLGLTKSAAYLATAECGRIRKGERRGAATQFKQGQTPANKGLRRKGWAAGRMAETQFRKGCTPRLWKPIGSTRLMDGYEYTKIRDERNVPYTVNWKATHIMNWEAVHGPVPDGHALKCLDGNRLNTAVTNWEAVPRGVLARLNGGRTKKRLAFDAAPAELKPTVMAVAKLQHAIAARRSVRS